MPHLIADLRFSARLCRRRPVLAATAVLALGLSIGANLAVFNLLNAFSQRPPVRTPERLAGLFTRDSTLGPWGPTSYPDWVDLRAQNRSFEDVAAYTSFGASVRRGGDSLWAWGALVSANYFSVLGVPASAGRTFTREEGAAGGPRVAVLGDALWHRLFAGDPGAIGRPILLNGSEFTVVGVAPARFRGTMSLFQPSLYIPIQHVALVGSRQLLDLRSWRSLALFGRLRPGVGLAAAQADVAMLGRRLDLAYPEPGRPRETRVNSLTLMPPSAREWYMPTVRLLMVAVAVLLLLGAANVAGVLLVRTVDRQAELGIRLALGAGRWRMLRALAVDGFVLAVPATLLGYACTLLTRDAIGGYFAPATPGAMGNAPALEPDQRVFFFSVLLALVTTLVMAVLPAWRVVRSDPMAAVRDAGGRETPPRRGRGLWGSGLIVVQVALSMVILTAALLLSRSFHRLRATDPGFHVDDIVLAAIDLQGADVPPADGQRAYERLLERVTAAPGVAGASLVQVPPLSGFARSDIVEFEGRTGEHPEVDSNVVGPGYFSALGIEVLQGRDLLARDSSAAPRVVLINESMARRYWPQGDALGRRIRFAAGGAPPSPWYEVVGVVRDTRFLSLGEAPEPELYTTYAQRFRPRLTLLVRARTNPRALVAQVRREVLVDPALGVIYATTLPEYLYSSIWEPRLRSDVLRAFALLTLLIAVVGVFAIANHQVLRRRREIGIRMALGASRSDVVRMILRQGAALALAGALLGGIASFWSQRLLASFLYGVKPGELLSPLLAALLLVLVALLATWLPAIRSSRVDPQTVIRSS